MLKVPMFRPHQIVLDREIGQLVRIVEWPRRLFITATGEPAYSYCLDRDPDIRLQVRTQADMESGRFVAYRGQTGVLPPDRVAGGIKSCAPSESLIDRGADDSEKKSPADICLSKRSTYLDFDPTEALPIYAGLHRVQIEFEHRAWICPFCQQATEYWVLNDSVFMGCGISSRFSNGKASDCCRRWECQQAQDQFHEAVLPPDAGAKAPASAGQSEDTEGRT